MSTLCHCLACQQRTGTSHQISAWFRDEQIAGRSGKFDVVEQIRKNGTIRMDRCQECGSTVSWTISQNPGARCFGSGCFADPQFPAPQIEFYTIRRHHWMKPVEGAAQFETQPE
jgi:hypothetical protein